MKTDIGKLILKSRSKMGMTQDEFARKYDITGPAIFKFENSFVNPTMRLWLAMAKDMGLKEKDAVLILIQAKLPVKYASYVTLRKPAKKGLAKKAKAKAKKPPTPDALRKAVLADQSAPKGLKQMLKDDDIWTLYKPQPDEIEILRTVFGKLGGGSKSGYLEALRLVREFKE